MSETSAKTKTKTSKDDETSILKVKCLIQQCTKAKLQVRLADKANNIEPEYVQIENGVVLFVCFMKDAQESDVDKLAKAVLNVRLSELGDENEQRVSVLDQPGSILIVPQATLGGRMKGKAIQYHKNVDRDKGRELYNLFIELCKKYANENAKWHENDCRVESGTYGIRQVYSTETNGPYLHLIEL